LKAERAAREKEVDAERTARKKEVDAERTAREKLAVQFVAHVKESKSKMEQKDKLLFEESKNWFGSTRLISNVSSNGQMTNITTSCGTCKTETNISKRLATI